MGVAGAADTGDETGGGIGNGATALLPSMIDFCRVLFGSGIWDTLPGVNGRAPGTIDALGKMPGRFSGAGVVPVTAPAGPPMTAFCIPWVDPGVGGN